MTLQDQLSALDVGTSGTSYPPNAKPKPGREIVHPKFQPAYLPRNTPTPLSAPGWVVPLSAPAYFPLDLFHLVLQEQSLHPEQNSSLILRAQKLPGIPETDAIDDALAAHIGVNPAPIERIRVRFVPRQARRDTRLCQRNAAYSSDDGRLGLVLKTPEVSSAAEMPYYHPPVRQLAFLWEADESIEPPEGDEPRVYGRIYIGYLPFEDSPTPAGDVLGPPPKPRLRRSPLAGPLSPSATDAVPPPATVLEDDSPEARAEARVQAENRLQRTCLHLLEKLHKHGHGSAYGYVKRVHHDVVVSREPFQDLYQALKERHKQLDSRVPQPWSTKVEDVKRHVWKVSGARSPDDRLLPHNIAAWGQQDIAIAAFLMLLWRDMYPAREGSETGMEWDKWGRPPGGFVDLGCGNGLLVHILVSEGYSGKGYELRQRRTWPQYPEATQRALVELGIDMPSLFPATMEEWDVGVWRGRDRKGASVGVSEHVIPDESFLLGNHADELTPWIPLLSLLPAKPVPFLSLPCCLHTLDGKFTSHEYKAPPHAHTPEGGFEDGLEAGASRYKAYVMWLGWWGLQCGWKWEKESLRIPSTRGWAIVARARWTTDAGEDRACRQWALDEVNGVRARGEFKVRVKEGTEH
ncbi:DUF1613-domain-containing protein [Cutaneotrichosporon oleaginosum]|uniref:tRNA (uracil-O(2)-)-methyltransferase n=1 Tax=Cutaneotrichosporon oleaginosum TaxID=879819 RepID=A0A0J0XIQ3_9TREE|nr:DUF1613-domain-containing protein [Cutaneotrichosporon oleaginosum]KLT40961.1 DUF1613-domain-containing protein [Cutaneotrichosporon oleaginosum]TXT06231.1 hypothetical protein COLE_05562 [Cutaneotrichosporon oleaginosum]